MLDEKFVIRFFREKLERMKKQPHRGFVMKTNGRIGVWWDGGNQPDTPGHLLGCSGHKWNIRLADNENQVIHYNPCDHALAAEQKISQPTKTTNNGGYQVNDTTRAKFTNSFLALVKNHFGEFKTVEGGTSYIRIAHVIYKMHENNIKLQALKKDHEGIKKFFTGNPDIIKTYEKEMRYLEEAINKTRIFIEACDH